jgi:hypothetical protein
MSLVSIVIIDSEPHEIHDNILQSDDSLEAEFLLHNI